MTGTRGRAARITRGGLAALVLGSAALVGCGTTADVEAGPPADATTTAIDEAPPTGGAAATTEPADEPTTEPAVDPTTEPDPGPDPSGPERSAELAAIVLQLDDLPTGWTVAESSEGDAPDDETPADTEDCASFESIDGDDPLEEETAEFQQSDFGPFAFSSAFRVADEDEARAILDEIAALADECATYTEEDDDGQVTNGTITARSFPALGDRTIALRLTTSDPELFTFTFDLAYTQVGDVLLSTAIGAITDGELPLVDPALLEELHRLVVGRV